jgi:predicted enzyme related to lactoylglutathione lyase
MIQKVAFTMYPVENVERARAFYENILGLSPASPSATTWVEYDLPGGGCFAITNVVPGAKASDVAGGTIAFEVDDLHGLVKELESKGVAIKMAPLETPVCWMAAINDPEGNGVLLHQLKNKKTA